MRLLSELSGTVEQLVYLSKANVRYVLLIIGTLVGIHIVNWMLGYRLNYLGVRPRHILGLPGIVCSPFLHGDFNHLFYNCIPLFFLLSFMFMLGMSTFLCLTTGIVLISGAALWLFGRRGLHVGASCVLMGYFSSLLMDAIQSPGMVTILIAILVLYYLGGLFFNLLPGGKGVSWEGHVFGFASGIIAVKLCPYFEHYFTHIKF